MSPYGYTEDTLVQQTAATYFKDMLDWDSVYAYNEETFGEDGTLGRSSQREVVLVRYLKEALVKLNPGLPEESYDSAIRQITETSVTKSLLQSNKEKYNLFKNGVKVSFRNNKGDIEEKTLSVFNFDKPTQNKFLAVREMWVQGVLYRRRPDIIGFVNGLPLLFMELKNVHKDLSRAYNENLSDYKDTIPEIFYHNVIVVLGNGIESKVGPYSAKYEYFHEWKRLSEEEKGIVDMETMMKGMFSKENFMDLFENFILFDDSTGKLVKILAKNHQYLGVNKALGAVKDRKENNGKLGVFWHTQGSGKSYSMVFFSEKVRRKLKGNFTFLVVTDREDLDTQIYKTYAGCGIVDNDTDKCRASSGDNLKDLVSADKSYVFTMIFKFNKKVKEPYTKRDDVIVITDEAHRTQYGLLALNMRDALPKAGFIGFTGTPLFKEDELTRKVFGSYVSTYDFQRAWEDGATVPLYYDNRGEKLHIAMLDINEKVAQKLEEHEFDINQRELLERELGRDYHIYTAEARMEKIAQDFVKHYTRSWESGKAMIVCIDKISVLKIYYLINDFWKNSVKETERLIRISNDDQETQFLEKKLNWLKETQIEVMISEEQGEVATFRKWGIDIIPHRFKIKNGLETPDGKRIDMDTAFKDPDHKFRVVIVCAMWLTGFDVPSLGTMYLDKPLKAHTLMQAIARANRVFEGKNNGLIVDYCGILKNLREALATFTISGSSGEEKKDPLKPDDELIDDLEEAINETRLFLTERRFNLDKVIITSGFERNAAIDEAKEVINFSEETRKKYEIFAREVFRKFRACINIPEIQDYKEPQGAINIIYKRLQEDKEKADITDVIKELQAIVDEAIRTSGGDVSEGEDRIYDISKIDFEKLREEFAKKKKGNTAFYSLKEQVEKRLSQMIAKNPLRMDLYKTYQKIIDEYNLEKDRVMIEKSFLELMNFIDKLDQEESRRIKEGLDEESLAVFDILLEGREISKKEREKIKLVAKELLDNLKGQYLMIRDLWEKEATRASLKTYIHDYLYNDKTGLPTPSYTVSDVEQKSDALYYYLYGQYGHNQ